MNNQFENEEESDIDPTMDKITSYKYLSVVLYLKVLFSNRHKSWISVNEVKNSNPKIVADYVMVTDLGEVSNIIERWWTRASMRSLQRNTRRLRRVDFNGFNLSRCDLTYRQFSLECTIRARRGETKASKKSSKSSRSQRNFKHGLEVPRSWKDVVRIDAEAENRSWQEVIEKEIGALITHDCFYFKTPNFKPTAD